MDDQLIPLNPLFFTALFDQFPGQWFWYSKIDPPGGQTATEK